MDFKPQSPPPLARAPYRSGALLPLVMSEFKIRADLDLHTSGETLVHTFRVPTRASDSAHPTRNTNAKMMLGNMNSRLNATSKWRLPVTSCQAAPGGGTHQHPSPHPMHPATKPASRMPRPEPLLALVPSTSPSSWSIHGRHVSITPEVEAHVRDRLARTLHTLQSADVLESEGGVSEVDVRLMNSQVGGEDTLPPGTASGLLTLTHPLLRPTSRCTPASSTSTCTTRTCSGGPSRARPMGMQMHSPTLIW